MICKILFLISNFIIILQSQFITNRNISLIIMIAAVLGVIFSLFKSQIRDKYKYIFSGLYVLVLAIYFLLVYLKIGG